MKRYVCIDIGGTYIKHGILDEEIHFLEKGEEETIKTNLDDFVNELYKLIEKYKLKYNISGVGISSPGCVNKKSKVIHGASALAFIHENDWVNELESRIGLKVTIENDANCAALAESQYGNGRNKSSVVSLVLGTGVGGAIIIDNKIFTGSSLSAGEFGFAYIDAKKPKVTFSGLVSTQSLVERVKINRNVSNGKEVFDLYDNHDEFVCSVVEQYYLELATLVFNINHMINPEIVLIGGGISARVDFVDKIKCKYTYLQSQTNLDTIGFNVNTCKFKNDANLIGALANHLN